MSLTSGFLLLFFTIVIPGFLFLRSYYYGEFSKQFNPKENITSHLLFGLIPGSIIQLICFVIGKQFNWIRLDSSNILFFFETVNNQEVAKDKVAQELIANPWYFSIYLLIVYAVSYFAGLLFANAIRLLKFDKKFKILRFKNQWYYVFSGEVFELKKFKSAANTFGRVNLLDQEVEFARVDVLIQNGGENEFYSGTVIDYDLMPSDPSKLENLYLMDAYRYERRELKNEHSVFYEYPRHTERKQIPGEVFVLNMCNMVNLNVSYLLAPRSNQQKKWLKRLLVIVNILLIAVLLASIYPIFWKVDWITWEPYQYYAKWDWWLDKILLFSWLRSAISFLIFHKDESIDGYSYKDKLWGVNIAVFIISGLIFFLVFSFV